MFVVSSSHNLDHGIRACLDSAVLGEYHFESFGDIDPSIYSKTDLQERDNPGIGTPRFHIVESIGSVAE